MKIKLILLVIVSFAIISDLPAQKSGKKFTVTGKVVDAYKSPISNAKIIIDGKDSGRKTDEDGNYKIKIKPSVLNLGVFTTITGIVEEPVNGRNTINFTLEKFVPSNSGAEVPLSEEDVVDSGYGVSRKKDLTKSVTKTDVSGKQYTTFNSIYDMLQTISGVYVSGSNVTIRGTATTGNTSPLFVVNGSVVSSISGIDPAMVSSIEVLKGPAASIYGMQGANGVIIIKLK
ncbi:MAG TPA: TonB-dependent receptor plug domain-containing protein [Bacteroidales bacterium]|jgi:TonB-dependent SusC/RagA subfamily outer membrane receptor|nr:TonB-dependent receptor plug domain-containing protein [Bacteroidales bacterium]OQB62761.1 MAG: TonB-dependent Receptor Plug Domain protein [Bacteroidetes bacterium ADurb.Bin145]HQG62330.1 TonB-dependent receptor plug domain-containing protein [Bacteroidales bacterium]